MELGLYTKLLAVSSKNNLNINFQKKSILIRKGNKCDLGILGIGVDKKKCFFNTTNII